jgi:enoyl-[acyl-carrier protein] reductase II
VRHCSQWSTACFEQILGRSPDCHHDRPFGSVSVMRTNNLCELLDITVPIIGAPFGPWNSVELAAAICEAGGLGSLGTAVRPVEELRKQWARIRELTDRPFALNHQPRPFSPEAFQATLDAHPALISYHMGDPGDLVDQAHAAGCLWMQQVMDVDQARRAVDRGADIIVAQGSEAGGHSGFVSTVVLVPQVVEVAGGRPVVAAGGIADGRGLAAALCLGASGVVMGTRFLASTEMAVRQEWKDMIVRAESRDARHSAITDLILPPYNRPHDPASARVLPTAFAEEWAQRPNELAQRAASLGPTIVAEILSGGGEDYVPFAGESVGLIRDIRPAADIVRQTMEEAEEVLRRLMPLAASTTGLIEQSRFRRTTSGT